MYKHAPGNYHCPFCAIARGDEGPHDPSRLTDVVYQDDTVTALVALHQYPRNSPNVIVIPNAHYENIYELPPALGADIQRVARDVAFALKHAYACDGISTRQHNEPAGSQEVWHYHLHVTPRFRHDGFYRNIYDKFVMPPDRRAEHAARVQTHMKQVSQEESQ